jgi:hypothetical protein
MIAGEAHQFISIFLQAITDRRKLSGAKPALGITMLRVYTFLILIINSHNSN